MPGQYIVVLKDAEQGVPGRAVAEVARALEARHEVKAEKTWAHALRGFAVKATEARARALAYDYSVSGEGVHVYVIDAGIRASHADFGGRVWLLAGPNPRGQFIQYPCHWGPNQQFKLN